MIRQVRAVAWVTLAVVLMATSAYAQERSYTTRIVGTHADEVLGVFVNDANSMVATCSLDETIKLWSLPDGKEVNTLTGHTAQVNNLSFNGDDSKIVSGSNDRTVRVWNIESGAQEQVLRGHQAEVIGVYWDPTEGSDIVASTSFDKTVKLWDAKIGIELKTLRYHTMQTNNVAYSYDGKYIASASDDRTARTSRWSL